MMRMSRRIKTNIKYNLYRGKEYMTNNIDTIISTYLSFSVGAIQAFYLPNYVSPLTFVALCVYQVCLQRKRDNTKVFKFAGNQISNKTDIWNDLLYKELE